MISWFKKHFIPHTNNDHRPHFLRQQNIRNLIILVLFLEIFTFLIPTLTKINKTGGLAAVLPAILANLTNEERQAEKLQTLTINPILTKAAEMKAQDMATKGYFAHTSPEGKTPWYWLSQAGYLYQYAGENLAINFTDSKDVTKAWMNSPTHKANIVKENYTEIGTGIATGMYQGKETVFVAQVYANPFPMIKEEIDIKKLEQEVKKIEVKTIKIINDAQTKILGAEIVDNSSSKIINTTSEEQIDQTPIIKYSFWQRMIASPRNSTNIVFFIIFGIIILSLILNIVIKIKHHHRDLITNGLIILAIIGAILVTNYYLTHKKMIILQSIDYKTVNR